jgi:cell division protein FtsW
MNKIITYFKGFNFSKNGWSIIIVSTILTILGIVMIHSASSFWALDKYNDSLYFVKRQILFALIGLVAMLFAGRISHKYIYEKSKIILLVGLILLILVAIPGIGIVRGGSRSWFGIGSFAVQPSELFKLCVVIFTAYMFDKHYDKTKSFYKVVVPILFPSVIGFGLIMLQPDLGSGVVMLIAIFMMSLASKAKFKNYILIGVTGLFFFALLIISEPYRLSRITAFVDPWEDPLGSGFQIIQSLYAIGPGGLLGLGFNASIQKHFYLPEPQTDFIFAILAEELGLIGGGFIILLFGLFIHYGFKIIFNCKDNFNAFLALGIVSLIGCQAIINLGVVVGLFPVTGITLPFISYGGSSLVITLLSVGILAGCDKREES